MAELQRSQSDQGSNPTNAENASHRSRASSVISTGTKFSISTMPPGHYHIDGVLEGSNRRNTRPSSLYSVRSMAPSLPPYEGLQPLDAIVSIGPHHGQQNAATYQPAPSDSNDSEPPLTPSDPENALSMHYGRVVRTIDDNHARQLARLRLDHEQNLSATRNAIDSAYRLEFKAKNREIERIREEAANEIESVRRDAAADVAAVRESLERLAANDIETVTNLQRENAERLVVVHEEHQRALEKARHAIEDLWEGRWSDRTRVEAVEAGRRIEERDAEWLRVLEGVKPELVEEMKSAMKIP